MECIPIKIQPAAANSSGFNKIYFNLFTTKATDLLWLWPAIHSQCRVRTCCLHHLFRRSYAAIQLSYTPRQHYFLKSCKFTMILLFLHRLAASLGLDLLWRLFDGNMRAVHDKRNIFSLEIRWRMFEGIRTADDRCLFLITFGGATRRDSGCIRRRERGR